MSEEETAEKVQQFMNLSKDQQAKQGIWTILMDWIMWQSQMNPADFDGHLDPIRWVRAMCDDMENLIKQGQQTAAEGNKQ